MSNNGKGRSAGPSPIDRQVKFEAMINGKVAEVIKKHNELAAQLAAVEEITKQVAGFVAGELGKIGGSIESRFVTVGRSLDGLDRNVLALAELAKEAVGQWTQADAIFKKVTAALPPDVSLELSEEEVNEVRKEAETRYISLMKSAFARAQARIDQQEREMIAAEEAAKKLAEEQAAATTEKTSVETELKKAAETERVIVQQTTGGPGTEFPDGAEIFGG